MVHYVIAWDHRIKFSFDKEQGRPMPIGLWCSLSVLTTSHPSSCEVWRENEKVSSSLRIRITDWLPISSELSFTLLLLELCLSIIRPAVIGCLIVLFLFTGFPLGDCHWETTTTVYSLWLETQYMKGCCTPQLLKSDGCKKRMDRSTIAWRADFHTLRTAYEARSSLGTIWSPPLVRVDWHAFARWADLLTRRTCLRAYNVIDTFWGPPKLGVEGLTLAWSAQLLTGRTELLTHLLIGLDTVVRPVVVLQYNQHNNNTITTIMSV